MERTITIRRILIGALFVSAVTTLSWRLTPSDRNTGRHDMVDVLAAARYVPAFTTIRETSVRTQSMPKAFLPPGALQSAADLRNDNGQYIFQSAIAIPEGQVLSRSLLSSADQNGGLTSLLRPGKVAVSFEVDKQRGLGGWVKPGDTVAVFGSHGTPPALLLPAVPVIAVDAERFGDRRVKNEAPTDILQAAENPEAHVLTVLVSPSDALALIDGRERGTLNVVLRDADDDLPWPALK